MHPNKSLSSQTFKIITQYGDMLVVKQGHHNNLSTANQQDQQQQQHQSRPIIMTFHDIGLNSELQFSTFCECDEVKLMLQTFTMIHVNFIGQEFAAGQNWAQAENLPDDFKYPSMEQMAECLVDVCTQLRVRSFIGLAVGAGAYIVSSLALIRPDLVDGLFLINPIISSCSITEWLYFKMSAIASNHHISHQHEADHHQHQQPDSPESAHRQSGLRRLLNAAHHLHIGHHHHHQHQQQTSDEEKSADLDLDEDKRSVGKESTQSSYSASSASSSNQKHQPGGRLRRLILSRNFRMAGSQQQARHSSSSHQLTRSSSSGSAAAKKQEELAESAKLEESRRASSDSASSQQRASNKRAPLEYLMYHHFGPSNFQRYRRSSDTPTCKSDWAGTGRAVGSQEAGLDSPAGSPGAHKSSCSQSQESLRCRSGNSSPISCLNLSSGFLASIASDRQRQAHMQSTYKQYFQQVNGHNLWLFAQNFAKRRSLNLRKDCGAAAHAAAAAAALGTSICTAFVGLTPKSAAPIGPRLSDSCISRASSSARSDRLQVGGSSTNLQLAADAEVDSVFNEPSTTTKRQVGQKQQAPALVAGTKVKRTFTCQTLIMCSSVQMHSDRAFKLMSLLNPLQATWIKTDHLLVLEESPEKVCQALRLFLQGIGYSMSTYERRLRLSSGPGSAGSNESSNGSGPSQANNERAALAEATS